MVAKRLKDTWKHRSMPIIIGVLLAVLVGLAVYRLLKQSRTIVNQMIIEHVQQLETIFKKINDTCLITGVAHDVSHINFLNVKSFVSSEVGPLNLAYPQQWQGPYVQDNPSMQGKVYEIVKTKHGYYIIPGKGVKLTNGRVMGKDILVNPETDVQELINNGVLSYQGKALAAPLPMKKGTVLLKPEIFEQVDA